MTIIRLAVIALLAAASIGATPLDGPTRSVGGWTATCDNLRACTVIASQEAPFVYIRVHRDGALDAPPGVTLVLVGADVQPNAAPLLFELSTAARALPERRIATYPAAVAIEDGHTILRASVSPGEPSLLLLDLLREATSLSVRIANRRATFDLSGLPTALRFVDERQGRRGTPSALVAKGMTPDRQVPPPIPMPIVRGADVAATAVDGARPDPSVLAMAEGSCDPEVVDAHEGYRAWRIGQNRLLISVPCMIAPHNRQAAFFLTRADGTAPQSVLLQRPPGTGDDRAENVVVNARFDPSTLVLEGSESSRGSGDCGARWRWVWTGTIFALLDATRLEECPGALPTDWPAVFRARRSG